MDTQPIILTSRLRLRPFTENDASSVQKLAGNLKIAETTDNIPHPYKDGMAEQWIEGHKPKWKSGELCTYAIVSKSSNTLIGTISLIDLDGVSGELGYWVGVDFWNQGYCTEASLALLNFGFDKLSLKKIHARHLSRNPASGKVLLKSGFVHIGTGSIDWRNRGNMEKTELYEIISS